MQFWHSAFQQYLAARALAARPNEELDELFRKRPSLPYDQSWKEVLLLLAQVLFWQGLPRVDRFISLILSSLSENSNFEEKAKCIELVGSMEADLAPLGYEGRDARYGRLSQDIQAELVRQIARSTCRTERLSHIGEMVAKLPEGETGFLKETPRIREMVQEIAGIQNQLDTISQPVLREPYARLLVKEIENFQYRIRGFCEPLTEEFTRASEAWLQIARSQLRIAESIAGRDSLPQVFRAGDPVDRDREAFVVRYAVMGEIERQVLLSSGCPGIVLYARRRMGKLTALRNLPAFLPKTVRIAATSMQRPQAFMSLASFMQEVTEAVDAAISPGQPHDQIPEDLGGFYRLLQRWNQSLQDRDERLIVAFDEYENIDEKIGAGVFPLDLLATVRESIQSHRHLTWLFSGSHEITELAHAEWTSYLVSARTIEIPPFSEAETRALLTDPMRHSSLWPDESSRPRFPVEAWGPNGIERIHAEAGGWPHLVQLIAETAVDLLNAETETRLTEPLLERALDKAIVSGHNVLHQLLRQESRLPGEWEYLAAFKSNDAQPPPADELLARSLQRRLQVEQTADGQWRLRVPLLQRWLRTRG